MFPDVAAIVVVPAAIEIALPLEPAASLITATDSTDELHVTDVVRSWAVLSEYVPVALNCCVVPVAMEGLAGDTEMDASVGVVLPPPPPPPPPPPSPPPHAAINVNSSKRISILPDFIYIHSGGDQIQRVSPALQVSHVPPFLDDNPVCFYLQIPAAMLAGRLRQSFVIFGGITA